RVNTHPAPHLHFVLSLHAALPISLRKNQKYFPLFDAAGKLLPAFLIVSNMKVADARFIVAGNERVVRPRLEDARFFYDQDRKVQDRKSTRLNSSHVKISYAVFCSK